MAAIEYNREKLIRILDDIYNIMGINIAVFDAEYKTIPISAVCLKRKQDILRLLTERNFHKKTVPITIGTVLSFKELSIRNLLFWGAEGC